MNVFCIKNVNLNNFHDVYLFLARINCCVLSSAMTMGIGGCCDIFIDKATNSYDRYLCGGLPFYCWGGHLRPEYNHPVIDANDLKGGGMCITNPRELTTTIILN